MGTPIIGFTKRRTMDIIEAIVSHYQEKHPQMQRQGNALFFQKSNVAMLLGENELTLLIHVNEPTARKVVQCVMTAPKTNAARINQWRGLKWLRRHAHQLKLDFRVIDYADPTLFSQADTALNGRSVHDS